ncbi:hypothetical protein [Paraburkholderia heleia]
MAISIDAQIDLDIANVCVTGGSPFGQGNLPGIGRAFKWVHSVP